MSFLLDTDTCSAHLKQKGNLAHKFLQYMGRLHLSVVTVGELYTWALRANSRRSDCSRCSTSWAMYGCWK